MIAILSPFNPSSVSRYFVQENILSINETATSVNNLVANLLFNQVEVCVFTTTSKLRDGELIVYTGSKIKVYVIGVKRRTIISTIFPNIKNLAQKIGHHVQKEIKQISLIHCHWTYEFAYACIPFCGIVPVICTVRDLAPVIYRNLPLGIRPFTLLNKLYWIYKKRIQSCILKNERYVLVANSSYTRQYIIEEYKRKCVELIYNSIEDNVIIDNREKNVGDVFVSISGSLDDNRKNIITLIKAFHLFLMQHNKNAKLLLVGSYHNDGVVCKYVVKHNLQNSIILLGKMSRARIMDVLDNSFCMIHPAVEETFGNILLEAMARRVLVVGGEHSGAVPEVLGYGKFGLLCDVTSYKAIYAEMLNVKNMSSRELRNILDRATHAIKFHYANSVIFNQYTELYKNILSV